MAFRLRTGSIVFLCLALAGAAQKGVGRDHNPGVLTVWMAGAGIRGGQSIGATDKFGWKASEQIVTAHDFHATILHLMGIDHKRLTYLSNGRNMRLTAG